MTRRPGGWAGCLLAIAAGLSSATAEPARWESFADGFFDSPEGACRADYEYFASSAEFLGVRWVKGRRAMCDWTNFHAGTGPVVPLPISVYQKCEEGVLTGGNEGYSCVVPETSDESCQVQVGNPIDVQSGAKIERRVDFSSLDGRFSLVRTYRSRSGTGGGHRLGHDALGEGWRFASDVSLYFDGNSTASYWYAYVSHGGGRSYKFSGGRDVIGQKIAPREVLYEQSRIGGDRGARLSFEGFVGGDTSKATFELTDRDGRIIRFETYRNYLQEGRAYGNGRPRSVTWPDGYQQTFTYADDGRMLRMEDSLGRWAAFAWTMYQPRMFDEQGRVRVPLEFEDVVVPAQGARVVSVELYDGSSIKYDYASTTRRWATVSLPGGYTSGRNPLGRLTGMTRSAGGVVIDSEKYAYQATQPFALTNVTDAKGVPYLTVGYDAAGNASYSTHPGGVDATTVEYARTPGVSLTRTVKNPLGRESVYTFNAKRYFNTELRGISGEATPGCAADLLENTKHGFHGIYQTTDREGRVTNYTYDSRGQKTRIVRAAGTPDEVRIETDWHPTIAGLPMEVRRAELTTTYTRDEKGRITSVTETDRTGSPAAPRTTTYAYADHPFRPASVDGPLPGPQDTTRFEYEGQSLSEVTDPLGQATTFSGFDAYGLPSRSVAADGVVTTYAYDAMHRPTRIVVDPAGERAVTKIAYDALGQVTRVTHPDGTSSRYVWDDARRLTRIVNAVGERIVMTYDAMSNLTKVEARAADGTLVRREEMLRDEIGRLRALTNGANKTTTYAYDREDNLTGSVDPRGGVSAYAWNGLDQLTRATDALSATTEIAPRPDGAVMAVTDAKDLTTTYERNGWGEVTAIISPDTGRTELVRDQAGRVTRRTDARGQVTTYAYDAKGRLLTTTYEAEGGEASPHDRANAYDAMDRMVSATDGAGGASYAYDARGRLTRAVRSTDGRDYALGMTYGAREVPEGVTYPSGRALSYAYDAAGRVSGVTMTAPDGTVTALARDVAYDAAGALTGLTHHNGARLTRTFDRAGRLTAIETVLAGTPVQDLTLTYDAAGNVKAIADGVRAERSQAFRYDLTGRLTRAEGAYGALSYRYDAIGNRERRWGELAGEPLDERTRGAEGTHAIERVVGLSGARRFAYHASGQLEREVRADGTVYRYELDPEGRVERVVGREGFVAAYAYDANGVRVSKRVRGPDGEGGARDPAADPRIHFVHAPDGRLLAEHDGRMGEALREYVYLGLMPVAMIQGGPDGTEAVYAVHTDQVGQPRKLTDARGLVVHDRVTTPFGERVVSLEQASLALSFPGQREDAETGLSQNWHRDYDPRLGRYVQSDPIGLAGGVSTYGYANQNPLRYVDPMGLDFKDEGEFGNGQFKGELSKEGIFVVDLPDGSIRCVRGGELPPTYDGDFFYLPGQGWVKIVNGEVTFGESEWTLTLAPFGVRQGWRNSGGVLSGPLLPGMGSWTSYGKLSGQTNPANYINDLSSGATESNECSCIGIPGQP